jgi:hypothetical protein
MFCPKSSPSYLYRWVKGGGTPSFHKIFYFGSLHSFNLFFAMGQSSCVIAKKESWTCERLIGTPVLKKGYICQGEKKKFHETKRKAQLAPMNVQFFSFKRGGKGHFFFPLFLMSSHHVPMGFPNTFTKMFPIAPWFYPIWLCPKFTSFVHKLKSKV